MIISIRTSYNCRLFAGLSFPVSVDLKHTQVHSPTLLSRAGSLEAYRCTSARRSRCCLPFALAGCFHGIGRAERKAFGKYPVFVSSSPFSCNLYLARFIPGNDRSVKILRSSADPVFPIPRKRTLPRCAAAGANARNELYTALGFFTQRKARAMCRAAGAFNR